jgi:hypothetical protein
MTEEEWLADDGDLTPLLRALAGTGTGMPPGFSSSVRKERLFAVACSRSEFIQDERLYKAIEVVERCADELATEDEVQKAREAATGMPSGPQRELALAVLGLDKSSCRPGTVAVCATRIEMAHLPRDPLGNVNLPAHLKIFRIQANLLRDIFGNPFRPVAVDPGWRTSNVVSAAEAIYTNRVFGDLPVLADALKDAGCNNSEIQNHCRQPAKHVRGCWVLDLLLGKK